MSTHAELTKGAILSQAHEFASNAEQVLHDTHIGMKSIAGASMLSRYCKTLRNGKGKSLREAARACLASLCKEVGDRELYDQAIDPDSDARAHYQ